MTHCQNMILEKGLQNVTVDDLVVSTMSKAKEAVPLAVKKAMIQVRKKYSIRATYNKAHREIAITRSIRFLHDHVCLVLFPIWQHIRQTLIERSEAAGEF